MKIVVIVAVTIIAAMSAAAARYAAENGCVLHQAREVGELENYSFLHGVICLRFPGETECLWFVQETGFEVMLGSEGAARMAKLFGFIQTSLVCAKPAAAAGYHMPLVAI
jgi:hypothetical protein